MQTLRTFGFLVKDVSRLFARNFERHAAGLGLTIEQCRVLAHLARNEGVSQARLAVLTDTDPMTLGRVVGRMEEAGLLERRPDPNDGRVYCLHLLEAASPLLERIWHYSDLTREDAFAGLTAADRNRLLKLMQHVRANLDALVPGVADRGRGTPRAKRAAVPKRRTQAMKAA
jgi:MarR family transcriptional regulator, transcriptional regulator for hemolysin